MKNKIFALAASTVILLLLTEQSGAGEIAPAGTLNYHIALVGTCTASVTPGPINLGTQFSYAGNISNANAGTISVTCASMPYKVCINGGDHPANPYRRLQHTVTTTEFLNYDLKFSGTVVGDKDCVAAGAPTETATWREPISAVGTGALQTFPLTADVIIPANSIPGTYRDTIVSVTIVW